MNEGSARSASRRRRWLRRTFVTGFVALLPLFLAFWAFDILFRWVDGLLTPLLSPIIVGLLNAYASARIPTGRTIPGIGFLATIIIVFVTGLLVKYVVSRRLIEYAERMIERIPLVGPIFASTRDFLGAFQTKRTFSKVVAVAYPLKGTYALAFVTGRFGTPAEGLPEARPMSYVFVVTTPNPTTGFTLVVPDDEIVTLPISVDEGVKLIVSAGSFSEAADRGERK